VQHFNGDLGHRREQEDRFDRTSTLKRADTLGDVLAIIANTFKNCSDLQCGNDAAQIVRHRRAQCDDTDSELFNLALQPVDRFVIFDNLTGEIEIARNERLHCQRDGNFGTTAHFGDMPAQFADILVECLDGMISHVSFLSRNDQ